jgi:hypothetical protein
MCEVDLTRTRMNQSDDRGFLQQKASICKRASMHTQYNDLNRHELLNTSKLRYDNEMN